MAWVKKLVGVTFLERFAPKKGRTNFLILFLPLITLLFVDTVSMQFFIYQELQECAQLDNNIKNLIQNGQNREESVEKLYQTKHKILQTLSYNKGIICKAHEKFPFVHIHSFFNKL